MKLILILITLFLLGCEGENTESSTTDKVEDIQEEEQIVLPEQLTFTEEQELCDVRLVGETVYLTEIETYESQDGSIKIELVEGFNHDVVLTIEENTVLNGNLYEDRIQFGLICEIMFEDFNE